MILTTWKRGEFKELLISRKLLENKLYRSHFWRLCFFEVSGANIRFLDLIFFSQKKNETPLDFFLLFLLEKYYFKTKGNPMINFFLDFKFCKTKGNPFINFFLLLIGFQIKRNAIIN